MSYIWTPDNIDYLISTDEDNYASATVTITADTETDPLALDPTEVEYELQANYIPPQITVETTLNSLTISAPNWTGLFPFSIKTIDKPTLRKYRYQNTWNNIDGVLYDYQKDASSVKYINLIITASGSSETETKTYILEIYANYSTNIPSIIKNS